MAWTQLINPTLPGKGTLAFCLKYARERYGIGPYYQTAWDAWMMSKYPHRNRDFPPVSVPLWFDYRTGGVQFGHVVIRTPDNKYYSSPYRAGTDYAILNSVEEVEQKYSAKYVGWSEDLNNVRVVINKEDDMATLASAEQVKSLAVELLNRQATPEEVKHMTGKPIWDVYVAWANEMNPERKNIKQLLDLGIQANKEGWSPGNPDGEVLEPGKYIVK